MAAATCDVDGRNIQEPSTSQMLQLSWDIEVMSTDICTILIRKRKLAFTREDSF